MIYYMLFPFVLFSIGIGGLAASRHFLVMVFSVEIMLSAAALLSVSMLMPVNLALLLFAIWAIATTEAITAIVLYRYISRNDMDLDIRRLSEYKY